MAKILYARGQLDKAMFLYQKALKLRPDDLGIMTSLSEIYLKLKHEPEALSVFNEMLRIDPKNTGAMINLAKLYRSRSQFSDALKHYIALGFDYESAMVYKELGETANALTYFEKAIKSDAGNINARTEIGELYLKQKKYSDALKHLAAVIELKPDSFRARYLSGLACFEQGLFERCRNEFEQCVKIDGTSADSFFYLAESHYNLENFAAARQNYLKALSLACEIPLIHNRLGFINFKEHNYEMAETEFKKALAKDAANVEANYHLALIEIAHARYNDAILRLKKITLNRNTSDTYAKLAEALYKSGHCEQALEEALNSLKKDPNNTDAHYYLGLSQKELKRYRDAETSFIKCCEINPRYYKAQLELGIIYNEEGKVLEAKTIFDSIEQNITESDMPEFYYNKAQVLTRVGDIEGGIKMFYQSINLAPKFDRAMWELGYALIKAGRGEEAIKIFERLLELDNKNAQVFYELGALYCALSGEENKKKALKHMHDYIAREPEAPMGYYYLGKLYQETFHETKAIEYYEKAIEYKPDMVEVCFELGRLYRFIRKPEKAITHLLKVIKKNSANVDALNEIAQATYDKKLYDEAVEWFEKVLMIKADNVDALSKLAFIYNETGRLGEAAGAYEKLLEISGKDHAVIYSLAEINYKLEKNQTALDLIKTALEIAPNEKKYLNLKGKILMALGRDEEAVLAFETVLGADGKNLEALYNTGVAKRRSGSVDEALLYFRRAVETNSKHIDSYISLSQIYREREDMENAIGLIEQAIAISPESDSLLYRLGGYYKDAKYYEKALSTFQKAAAINPSNSEALFETAVISYLKKSYADALTALKKAG
ncbi:MAG TPA: tetratricopeptide repeat protein, partial [Candidatus Wallbacteria bacterium]|nr:tetratricopeptide repeat protein [Candidatus Wallbacteria bacterium]